MEIFICTKDEVGMDKVLHTLLTYHNFKVKRMYKHLIAYDISSMSMRVDIICEQSWSESWNARGYRANLIYVQNTVSEKFIDTILQPMLKPFIYGFDNGVKIPCVPIQYFDIC